MKFKWLPQHQAFRSCNMVMWSLFYGAQVSWTKPGTNQVIAYWQLPSEKCLQIKTKLLMQNLHYYYKTVCTCRLLRLWFLCLIFKQVFIAETRKHWSSLSTSIFLKAFKCTPFSKLNLQAIQMTSNYSQQKSVQHCRSHDQCHMAPPCLSWGLFSSSGSTAV